MANQLPEGAFAAVPDPMVIADGQQDFAYRTNGERLRVSATGRTTFQHVFVYAHSREDSTPGNRGTNTKDIYDAKQHRPDPNDMPASYLPTESELVQDEYTKEFLEVGLVLARDPSMYLNEHKKGKSRDVELERERRARLLERTEFQVLRVYTEITEYMPEKTEFFVGCLFRDGHHELKKTKMEYVFFYAEFQPTASMNKKSRKRAITANIKLATALNPIHNARTADDPQAIFAKIAARHPVKSICLTNMSAKLQILWSLYRSDDSGSKTQYLRAMVRTLQANQPDMLYCAGTEVDGVRAFMDFDEEFTMDLSQAMERELKTVIPEMPALDHIRTVEIHKILRERDEAANIVHGQKLPYRGLGLFLYLCHTPPELGFRAQSRDDVLKLLNLVNVVLFCTPASPAFPQHQTTNNETDAVKVVIQCLQGVSVWVHSLNTRIRLHEAAMAERYGDIISGMSLDDIHEQLATVVDLDSFKVYASQIAAVQAAQRMALDDNVNKVLAEMDDLVKQVLALVPEERS